MSFQTRYSFKKVALVTAIVCIGLFLFGYMAIMLVPAEEREKEIKMMMTTKSLIRHIVLYVFLTVFYYFTINKFYSLIAERSRFKKYIPVLVMTLGGYISYYCVMLWISPNRMKDMRVTLGLIIFSVVISAMLLTAVGLLIAYLTSLRDEQKQRKVLEKQKMELEVQNSQANFNFLKAQINPHFLHNTLNFFYAKALPLSAELSEGILCLSDIMRYALNEGGKDEKSLLKDEIEHLENVIRINQLRFSNNLNVQFEVAGEVGGAMIVPFVLITLVENAFKHGDLRSREHPIVIRIKVEGRRLYFYCRNKKNPGFKEISTGIGLQNILKRLAIMYGSNYKYQVTDEPEFYTTELIINEL